MTYLMSEKYAKKNGYTKDNVFSSSLFTPVGKTEFFLMEYINYYEYFPLIQLLSNDFFTRYDEKFSMVTSAETYEQLYNSTSESIISYMVNYLIIDLEEDANKTAIFNTLYEDFDQDFTTTEIIYDTIMSTNDAYSNTFFIIASNRSSSSLGRRIIASSSSTVI